MIVFYESVKYHKRKNLNLEEGGISFKQKD